MGGYAQTAAPDQTKSGRTVARYVGGPLQTAALKRTGRGHSCRLCVRAPEDDRAGTGKIWGAEATPKGVAGKRVGPTETKTAWSAANDYSQGVLSGNPPEVVRLTNIPRQLRRAHGTSPMG